MKALALGRAAMLILALFLVVHGWFGPQFSPKNLTALFVWIHYRGLLVFALLIFGNLFCGMCPIVFLRDLARRWISPRRNWPRAMKNKWLASCLFVLFLFGYEHFGFWARPKITSLLIVGYFLLALVVDLLFKKASFCQFLCPVGQFNFLSSLISPFSVKAKSLKICQTCESKACLRGSSSQRGCELGLFVPKKAGNWNCTFCMDCAKACPHDNVTLGLADDFAVSAGRFWQRSDITALIFAFVFGAIFNAFAMVEVSRSFTLVGMAALTFIVLPLSFLVLSQSWGRLWSPKVSTMLLAPALIPLGFAVWMAHYSYHFLTGALTFVPVTVSLWPGADIDPMIWASFPMGVPLQTVAPFQTGCLVLGAAASLIIAQKRARTFVRHRPLAFAVPWHILILGLTVFAAWVFSLPMDMRGTFVGG